MAAVEADSKDPKKEASELPDFKEIGPDQMLLFFQNQNILIDGNANKSRQNIFDQMAEVMKEYIKQNKIQANELTILKDEVDRIQRICKEHNIDVSPPKTQQPKNRKERRATQGKK